MTKVALFPALLGVACLVAGLYGGLHNQISYTVAPDYFHAYKFRQFDIPAGLQGRAGAALVGWYASWWMGLLIGIPVLLVAHLMPNAKTYLIHSLAAFGVVAGTALAIGLGALAIASGLITENSLPPYHYPEGVADKVAFARAGTMHNFSYLGGFLGIVTATQYLVGQRVRLTRRYRCRDANASASGRPIPSRRRRLISNSIFLGAPVMVVVGVLLLLQHLEHGYLQAGASYSAIEDGLFMGGYVQEPPPGTNAVLNLCASPDPYHCATHRWEPIRDTEPAPDLAWLRRMVAFVDSQRKAGIITYVHCRNGVSRSGLVITAYLMFEYGWTRDEALAFVRSQRPEARPNPAFMKLLAEWEQALKEQPTIRTP